MPVSLTYTLLALAAGALVAGLWLGGRAGQGRLRRIARFSGAMQLGAIVLAYVVLRPGAGDGGRADIAAAQAAEQPIFIDLYSNF